MSIETLKSWLEYMAREKEIETKFDEEEKCEPRYIEKLV
jgi:hypothetical protein